MKPVFFTYAPKEVEHPYILRNIKQKPQKHSNWEIVDIGIYDLLHEPYRHSNEKLIAWNKLKTDGWKVVPDVPDIKGEFNKAIDYDNTEYSWHLLKGLFNPDDESHLPVIQSRYTDYTSLRNYCNDFIREYGQHDKIAVGTICKMHDGNITRAMLKMVRRYFPDSWIHAFGLRLNQFKRCHHLIDSFDSTSWTFPRTPNRPSCKNKEQCIEYFYEYMDVVKSYTYLHGQKVLI